MAVTKAAICNLALAHLQITDISIANLDTDEGDVAVQCRLHYDVARRAALYDHNWNCATRREQLALLEENSADFLYRYSLPTDYLKIQEIQRPTRNSLPIEYKVETDGVRQTLLTNEQNAVAVLTFDLENTSLFSPGLVTSFGWALAAELAPALTGDLELQQMALTVYQNTSRAAEANDSGEGLPDPEIDAPWIYAQITAGDDG